MINSLDHNQFQNNVLTSYFRFSSTTLFKGFFFLRRRAENNLYVIELMLFDFFQNVCLSFS